MTCEALFNSWCFIGAFLPLTLLGYWLMPPGRWRLGLLTFASFTFYSFWDVRFTALIVAAALVEYLIALRLHASSRPRWWLIASIAFNLGVLGFFKYWIFAATNANTVLTWLGSDLELPLGNIILPVGISFFTFKTLSYTIDVYRRDVVPTRDVVRFLAYVSMFPDLVAGPIVRYRSVGDALARTPRWPQAAALGLGITLFALGLFKKVALADPIAAYIDPLWAAPGSLTATTAWVATVGYTLQLYLDFSGYSDMAIGLASLIGLAFPDNFRAPYRALNPVDFWRRWHITLSAWLRDYVYIPLGGNRSSRRRVLLHVMIVMAIGGLWHGASWTFVVWGLFHGALLVLYRLNQARWDALPGAVQVGGTLLLVVLGWVLFRAPDLATAGEVYRALAFGGVGTITGGVMLFVLAASALLVLHGSARPFAASLSRRRPVLFAVATGTALVLGLLSMTRGEHPFLYYRF